MLGDSFKILEPREYEESRRIVDEIRDEIYERVIYPNFQPVSLMGSMERVMLYEVALGLHNKPDTRGYVLEFGSWYLASAILITKAMLRKNDGCLPVVAVDPYGYIPENPFDPVTMAYLESRRLHYTFNNKQMLRHLVRVMNADLTFLKIWNHPTRMIFIDTIGDYTYTKQEIHASLPHLVDDSWLVFHDYFKPNQTGLIDAVDEFITTQQEWELEPYKFVEELGAGQTTVGLHMIRRKK